MVARRNESGPDRDGRPLPDVVKQAVHQLADLTGQPAHQVTGVRASDNGGWSVLVDIVELERIPQSTSLLATYRVDVDDDGQLVGYERLRRFTLGAADPS